MLFLLLLFNLALSQPSFYITFHGGKSGYPNIGVYSLTGASLGDLLSSENGHIGLRSLVISKSTGIVYICSATDSMIIQTQGCGNAVTVTSSDPNLSHPYGITLDDSTGTMYVSNQDGANVIAYSSPTATPTIFASTSNPRGITVDPDTSDVYVGVDDAAAVQIFFSNGTQKGSIPVSLPIGLYIDSGVLYVSDHGTPSGVYGFNITTWQKIITYKIPDGHPTGIVTYNGMLYVLGQDTYQLYQFNIRTGQLQGSIATFSDYPEQITLGPCTA